MADKSKLHQLLLKVYVLAYPGKTKQFCQEELTKQCNHKAHRPKFT